MTLLLAVLFMALAVDAGRLWMQQRKLQSIADIASMEAARNMGCSINLANVQAAAQAAAARNGYTGQLLQAPNVVEVGSITTVAGVRQFLPGTPEEAVHVYVTQSVPASLVTGGLFGEQVVLHAEAVSVADPPLVSFTAGSFLIGIDSTSAPLMDQLLGGLLGTSFSLDLDSYKGLASANLTLLNLMHAQGGTSNINELLNTEMSLRQLVDLVTDGVAEAGTASSLATLALQQLGSGSNNTTVKLADILQVSAPNQEGAAEANINALSLITAAAMFANEGQSVSVSAAGITAQVTIGQAPLLAVGPSDGNSCTSAHSAQLALSLAASLGVASVSLTLAIAPGTAELVNFSDNGDESQVIIAATPSIASLNLSAKILGLTVPLPSLAPIGQGISQDVEFDIDHPTATNLPQTMSVASPIGGSLANALQGLGVLSPLLSPLLETIGDALLDPLLKMLGIQLGGMDITVTGIQLRQAQPLII